MNIVIRLKDFIQLQHIWMPDLAKEIDLIMQAEDTLDVVIEHFFAYRLECELSLGGWMLDLIYFGEVAFTNDVDDVILASQVLQDAEILYEVVPFLERSELREGWHAWVFASGWSCEDDGLVDETDDYALLHI